MSWVIVSRCTKPLLIGLFFTLFSAVLTRFEVVGQSPPALLFNVGLGFTFLMIAGTRYWPVLAIAFGLNLALDGREPWMVVAGAVAYGLANAAGALVLEKSEFDRSLTRPRSVILLSLAAMVASILMAVTIPGILGMPHHQTLSWFLTNLVSIAVVAPVAATWWKRPVPSPVETLHLLSCVMVTAIVAYSVFATNSAVFRTFHLLPVMVWAALGFQNRGLSLVTLICAIAAYYGTTQNVGVFTFLKDATLQTQQYIVIQTFTMLTLASMADLRKARADAMTAKHDAEEREARYRAIFETAVDGIIVIDAKGIIHQMNSAAEEMLGYEPGESIGKHVSIMMPPKEGAMHDTFLKRALTEQPRIGKAGLAVEAVKKDGTLFPAHFAIAKSSVGEEVFFTGIMRDLTKEKSSETARALLAQEVDHRAKNNLAVIQSLLKLTKAATVEEFVRAVTGRIESLARAHSLLSQGKWEGAKLSIVVGDELEGAAKGAHVEFHGPPIMLEPNSVQPVAMVIHELTTNAIKYGALSSALGSVSVEWYVEGGDLILKWAEAGGPHVRSPERTGFGSRMLNEVVVKQLHGKLEFDWRPAGVVATIQLPASTFRKGTVSHKTAKPEIVSRQVEGDGRRILLIEDNALIALEMTGYLENCGFHVVGHAASLHDAMSLVDTLVFDAAIVDIDLGGVHSFPAAERLRERGTPFIFCTGFESLAANSGFSEVPTLRKPVNQNALLMLLDEVAQRAAAAA